MKRMPCGQTIVYCVGLCVKSPCRMDLLKIGPSSPHPPALGEAQNYKNKKTATRYCTDQTFSATVAVMIQFSAAVAVMIQFSAAVAVMIQFSAAVGVMIQFSAAVAVMIQFSAAVGVIIQFSVGVAVEN